MTNGIYPSDLPSALIVDAVLALVTQGGVTDLRQAPLSALVTQLATQLTVSALGGPAYPTVADGLAAVADGAYFTVPDSGGLTLYRRSGTAAVQVAQIPGQADIDAAIAAAEASLAAQVEDALGAPLYDEEWADVWAAGPDGRPLAGVTPPGHLRLEWEPIWDEEFAWAIRDEAGLVAIGGRHDGSIWTGPDPVGRVWLRDGLIVAQIGSRRVGVTWRAPDDDIVLVPGEITTSSVTWYEDNGSALTKRTADLIGETEISSGAASLLIVLCYGQSLMYGTGSSPASSTAPVKSGRAQMFLSGPRIPPQADIDTLVDPDLLAGLVDLREIDSTESPAAGIGWAVTSTAHGAPAARAALVANASRGGLSWAALSPGSTYWANLVAAADRGRTIASLQGLPVVGPVVTINQGQADKGDARGVYYARMVQARVDITRDIGLGVDSPVFIAQISEWGSYGDEFSHVPFDQLAAGLTIPGIICSGPTYWLARNNDGRHFTGVSSAQYGDYLGLLTHRVLSDPSFVPALYCTGATRSGATITLEWSTPPVIDTSLVTDPGNLGLFWNQVGGVARTISSVAISGTTVVVTLSGDPGAITPGTVDDTGVVTGGSYIGIADRTTAADLARYALSDDDPVRLATVFGPQCGPRTCLRSASIGTDQTGIPLYLRACHQRVAVA